MSKSRLSRRYARALFSLGQQDGAFDQYGRELMEFTSFYKNNEDFRQVISNPIFAVAERKEVLKVVLEKSEFLGTMKNFLNLLLDKNRIGAIDTINNHYQKLTDDESNIANAEIVTARPLKKGALKKIGDSLEKLTSKKIRTEVKEDKDLIGGIVVKIGDLVLDGSVKAQLRGLKESFKRGE